MNWVICEEMRNNFTLFLKPHTKMIVIEKIKSISKSIKHKAI